METLRDLLIQRAARLQERPAISAPGWGTFAWSVWRSRVEGVALGLLATSRPTGTTIHSATGGPWDWACEVAGACCGLLWGPEGEAVDASILGGPLFNADAGRGPYHDRDHGMDANTRLIPGLTHGEFLARLRRLNGVLGWDHETRVRLPLADLANPATRAALWSLLYAGGHAVFTDQSPGPENLTRDRSAGNWTFDPAPFAVLGL